MMRLHLPANLLLVFTLTATAQAALPIELELAEERGLQITAPHQWLQLLTSLGLENVRIRGAHPGDSPQLINRGNDAEPSYHVVGILTARDELRLPGGTFHAGDRQKLRDYFKRLAADGAEAITAPRGRFGLTEKQFAVVHADLAQPIDFATKGQLPRAVMDRLQAKFALRMSPDAAAEQVLHDAAPVDDEVQNLTAGTGLAIVLRNCGLALRPEKALGQPVVHRIVLADAEQESWPIGWEPEQPPGKVAPVLLEFLNVEIDGYTLAETLDAIGPRIKLPIYWDHAALAAHHIDPTAVKVTLPRTRTFYKRVLDRALAQARLAGQLRVDEAGTAFYWITK
jgi:hypothetical protein